MNNKFTQEELYMISNGILSLINNATRAKELVTENEMLTAIENEISGLMELNRKVCNLME